MRARIRRKHGVVTADWTHPLPRPVRPNDYTTPPLYPGAKPSSQPVVPGPRPPPPWMVQPGDLPVGEPGPPGPSYPWPQALHGGLGQVTWPKTPFGHDEGEPPGDEEPGGGAPPPPGYYYPYGSYPYSYYPYGSYPYSYYPSWYTYGVYGGSYGGYPGAWAGQYYDYYPDYYAGRYDYTEPRPGAYPYEPEYAYCPEDTSPDLARALKDIALSWIVEDIELLARHLPEKGLIQASDDAADYERAFTRDELLKLTTTGFANTNTQEFRFTSVDENEAGVCWAEAQHVYTDERGTRRVAVVRYHLYSEYGEWYIDAIALKSDRAQ